MTPEDWDSRWKKNQTGFHKLHVNESLLAVENCLLAKPKRRVYVPLCGKSVDMKYLADKGHSVVGLEFSELAILEFFKEQSLKHTSSVDANDSSFTVYKACDEDIVIYKGDFFAADERVLGKFDAIWDRGSWVAINPQERKKYAQLISCLVNSQTKYALNAFTYDQSQFGGPPYSCNLDDINCFFSERFHVSTHDYSYLAEGPGKPSAIDVFKVMNYILTPIY